MAKEEPRKYLALVLSNNWLSKEVFHLSLNIQTPFQAGQYMMMHLPEYALSDKRLSNHQEHERKKPKAYSIASPPSWNDHLEFLIALKDGGVVSPYLASLKEGDSVPVKGPLGKFVIKEIKKEFTFIATGTGIAPFRSMIHDLLKKNPKQQINLFYGFRSEHDFLLQEEWSELAKKYEHFRLVATCSRPNGTWSGLEGRVTSYLHEIPVMDNDVYICGSEPMIHDTKHVLEKRGFEKGQVHIEIW